MKIQRDWAAPLTIGAFGLLAVTGVLMFFHLDTGLNKTGHEWLGWVLVAAAGAPGATEASSVSALVGDDTRRQVRLLGQVLATR